MFNVWKRKPVPGWPRRTPLLTLSLSSSSPHSGLGCAFRLVFRFIPVLIFRNSGFSAKFPDSGGTHVGIKSFQGKINLLRNSGSGIPEAFYATCNKHSACRLKNNTKIRCQRWHSACCCFRAPPQAATPCCHHCCHCSLFPSPLPSP